MAYIGIDPNVGDITFQKFTGDGSATAFTLAQNVASGEAVVVTIGNVVQEPGASAAYTAYGNTLTFSAAPANGDIITVRYFGRAVDQPLSYAMQLFKFVATASQTVFTGADNAGAILAFSGNDVDVYLNGVHLDSTDYTPTSGTTITLASAAALNDELVIRAYRAFSVTDTVSAASGGTFNGGVTINGNLSVDTGTIKLDGNYPVGTGNVALGDAALDDASLSGNYNTAVGNVAMTANTTGEQSVGIGHNSLGNNTTGNYNVAVGFTSLYTNNGSDNVAIGQEAAYNNSSGGQNTAVGKAALRSNTTPSGLTAVGMNSLNANTTGANNAAFGAYTLALNTTGQGNSGFGSSGTLSTLYSNTTGSYNTAMGTAALFSNTTASNNTAVGYQAAYSNTTGVNLVALGGSALSSNTTGSNNVGLGLSALRLNTTGDANIAIGTGALDANTGSSNTAVGHNALVSNTTASYNTAVGYQALYPNTTGAFNAALGSYAGFNNVLGQYQTCLGYAAGFYSAPSSGSGYNTFVGGLAGYSVTTGAHNTLVGATGFHGRGAGHLITTGSKNTVLGSYDGNQGGLDIRTASNNIVLSDGDGNPRQYFNSGTWFIPAYVGEAFADTRFKLNVGNQSDWAMVLDHALVANQYFMSFRHLTTQIGSIIGSATSTAFNTSSDYRLKENVVDLTGAANRVQQLNPVRFNFIADGDKTVDGFLAHEVADIVPEAITGEKDAVDDEGNIKPQGIDQSKLVPLLTAALQEALTKIDQLETRIAALEAN